MRLSPILLWHSGLALASAGARCRGLQVRSSAYGFLPARWHEPGGQRFTETYRFDDLRVAQSEP
ncbi:MAG TPA: hypothetical protein VKT77_05425, partial [Chthonomonadaceae bacterium]|nr:hypothetical protein [Chthonomonadaceae bacterium]